MHNVQIIHQIVLLSACFHVVSCSIGDRLKVFQDCLSSGRQTCQGANYPAVLPWHLRVFGWTCIDELKYQCMHTTTQLLLDDDINVYLFYGKVCIGSVIKCIK